MGAWVARQQAFAVIAKKCSAAQALSLKQMKESCSYEKLGLSWDNFCQQHAGISRVYADRIIRRYQEFGEACFRLSSLARISPEGYREIAISVEDNCIEIDGHQVPIVPENAAPSSAPSFAPAVPGVPPARRPIRPRHGNWSTVSVRCSKTSNNTCAPICP